MHFTTLALIAITGAPSILASPLLAERAVVSVSSTCSATVPQPTPQPLICGQEGRLRQEKGYLSTSPDNMFFSAEHCYQSCRTMTSNNKGCLTFAYNAKNGSCMYYSRTIKSQDFIVDQSTSEVFYNNRCWKNKCTVIKSTVSAAPTSTKTSSVKPTKTSKVKSTKTSSVKPTSTKVSSTKVTSAKPTSTKASSTKPTSTKASSTKTKPTATPTTCPSNADLSIAACQISKVTLTGGLGVLTLTNYFSGEDLTENVNNPGNLLNGLLSRTVVEFPSTITACDAVSRCSNEGSLLGLANVPQSFDLHLVESANDGCSAWECVLYGGANTDDSQFNVRNDSIKTVFGYSGTVAGISLPILG